MTIAFILLAILIIAGALLADITRTWKRDEKRRRYYQGRL